MTGASARDHGRSGRAEGRRRPGRPDGSCESPTWPWGSLDLSPDEAHYWEWSRRLDLSYYSKGPLIAYLIAGLTAVFGTSALGIRLGAVGLSLVGAWALYRLGRELYGRPEPGALAVIGLQVTPLVWAGSLLMTIDAPFVVAWTLGLWAAHRAVTGGGTGAWALLGLAIGVGSLAKYAMLFALPGLALYLWRAPERRRALGGAGPDCGGPRRAGRVRPGAPVECADRLGLGPPRRQPGAGQGLHARASRGVSRVPAPGVEPADRGSPRMGSLGRPCGKASGEGESPTAS